MEASEMMRKLFVIGLILGHSFKYNMNKEIQ